MNEQLRNLTLEEMDQLSLMHPVASIADNLAKAPMILQNGSGVRLTDNKGQSFIDGSAGLWCVNIGYGRERVARAAYEEMQRMGYYHTFVMHRTSRTSASRIAFCGCCRKTARQR